MLGNIILGFIIPILVGGYILKNNLRILLTYFPLGIASSACINSIGFNYYWNILPNTHNQSFAALPMDLGLYPIAGCLMMLVILKKRLGPG
ncbi:hypothetical protein [Paenibacillus sp. MABNR03]|uniref:hypothetical protein n=1 Tax=Paenibacillus sp. MABNR03 TaxID=3142626 RepID=UPI003D2C4E88